MGKSSIKLAKFFFIIYLYYGIGQFSSSCHQFFWLFIRTRKRLQKKTLKWPAIKKGIFQLFYFEILLLSISKSQLQNY